MSKVNKGSQSDLRKLVNKHPTLFEEAFADVLGRSQVEIEWLSPLGKEEYEEYCTFPGFIEKTDKETLADFKKKLKNFWPRRKPQWDGIAFDKTNKEYLLIEAKAHIHEIFNSGSKAKNEESIDTIEARIKELGEYLKSAYPWESGTFWLDRFYQMANRLAFLKYLNDYLKEHKLPWKKVRLVYLVFLNNDIANEYPFPCKSEKVAQTKDVWIATFGMINKMLGLGNRHKLSKFITHVFIDRQKMILCPKK